MQFNVKQTTTLLPFLKECFSESSTSQIKKWIEQGRFEKNEKTVESPISPLKEGDVISFLHRPKKDKKPFNTLYEDSHFIVIDKPAGLLSVDTESADEISLHAYLKKQFTRKKIWVVHRLDKDTSGVILFALEERAYRSLKDQLKERTMNRQYLALVEGVLEGAGTWDTHLLEDSSLTMQVVPPKTRKAQRAITHWKALGNDGKMSLIECHLHTGKKNQIRVQACHSGHPIVGDIKYKSTKKTPNIGLHALTLECVHPNTQEKMTFTAPIPPSFSSLFSRKLLSILEMKTR
jgi:tRNA pseudouridine32 synthase/23S rRNA pseudouridine746 synthase/23S rRNA pseudouridine1911/1915/1917 synthase